jgi:hypothetical protein
MPMLYLALGFIGSSSAVFAALYGIGAVWGQHLPATARTWAAVVLLAACAVADIAMLATGRQYSVGWSRQTPRRAVYQLGDRLGALVWGLDTGLAVTTFRMSAATWAALGLALLNVAPAWAGVAYGLGFVVPLAVSVLRPRGRTETEDDPSWLPRILSGYRRAVQWAGVALILTGVVLPFAA